MYREKKIVNFSKIKAFVQKYRKPPIPEGFEYVSGRWNGKFIIRNKKDSSEFAWIPADKLERVNFQNDDFSFTGFHEEITDELMEQRRSVKRYGGFYISRFNISRLQNGEPVSIEGGTPWTQINWYDAKNIAEKYANGSVKSHLPYGSEIDTTLIWVKDLKENRSKRIIGRCLNWRMNAITRNISVNVSQEKGEFLKSNDIYNFDGNIDIWTQEKFGTSCKVIRGSGLICLGEGFSTCFRSNEDPNSIFFDTGFRIVLCLN